MRQSFRSIVLSFVALILAGSCMVLPVSIQARTVHVSASGVGVAFVIAPYSGNIDRVFVNGQVGLCIEPSVPLIAGEYEEEKVGNPPPISQAKMEKVKLLTYYGRKLGMETDARMFAIIQIFVWEVIIGKNVDAISGANLGLSDYWDEKAKIQAMIDKHAVLPSFDKTTLSFKVGETRVLQDTNGVLDQFAVVSSNPDVVSVSQSGSTLTLMGKREGEVELHAQKVESAYVGDSYFYTKRFSQTVGLFKLDDPVQFRMNVTAESPTGSFELTKTDSDGNLVAGAQFDIDGKSYTTNEKGKIIIEDIEPKVLSFRETAVPKPLLLDGQLHTVSIHAGVTTKVDVVNAIARGVIGINKKREDGKPASEVVFAILDGNEEVATMVTDVNGNATSRELPLKQYAVVEKSGPEYLILDPTPRFVDLVYRDHHTAVIEASLSLTNHYKPVLVLGVHRVRIDTKRKDEGLVVEAWFDLTQNYDFAVNDFKDAAIRVEVLHEDIVIAEKHYTAQSFPNADVYEIAPERLLVDDCQSYTLQIVVDDKHKVELTHERIEIDGYTASEKTVSYDVGDLQEMRIEGVIRTERIVGEAMVLYWERFDLEVPHVGDLIAGRGFHYDGIAAYHNQLGNKMPVTLFLELDMDFVDGDWFETHDSLKRIPLLFQDHHFHLPRIFARKDVSGAVINETVYSTLSFNEKERYRDGGYQLLTPLWADLKVYDIVLKSEPLGVHEITIVVTDTCELYAYLYGWENHVGTSPTIHQDQVLIRPVFAVDLNNDGMMDAWEKGHIPDNWGLTLPNGSKKLKDGERMFLNLLTR